MTDARSYRDMAAACRRAAEPVLRLSEDVARCLRDCPSAGSGMLRAGADVAQHALRLEQAGQLFDQIGGDPVRAAQVAHILAGGDVVLVPRPVVVGQDHQPRQAAANDAVRGRFSALMRRLTRRFA